MPASDERLGAFLLGPAPCDGGFQDDDWWIWCGSPARADDGRYHLFASRWSKRTAFTPNWLTNSRIVRAVADAPMGPYAYADEVLPPRGPAYWDGLMTHNPTIHRHGDTWLLFYTGTTYDGAVPLTGKLDRDDPRRVQARAGQRIGLATAPSPAGPWTRREAPILEPRPGHWDALMTTNPAPVVHADGSVLLLYKSTEDDSSRLRYGVAWADHWAGPYRRLRDEPLFDTGGTTCYEDACVWHENGRYQMIFKDMSGHVASERDAGAHADSPDGVTWTVRGPAYGKEVLWSDGRRVRQACFERPQILRDAQGRAAWLFAATGSGGPGGFVHAERTWTMVRPFRLA